MKIVILGIDGYLGWPLALHLSERGHTISGIDNGARRLMAPNSLIPLPKTSDRSSMIPIHILDVSSSYIALVEHFHEADCIVHLAEQPSAPWSMASYNQTLETIRNNVLGTMNVLFAMHEACPSAHLLKLGSMGEYGTPNCDIPEGEFYLHFRDRETRALFPRDPGSWYHTSKVQDTYAVRFACKLWGLRSTDVMQGVVYGVRTDECDPGNILSRTRFDYDEHFGTAINRFCACALAGIPPTIYGAGYQVRGFLPIRESIKCMRLAIESPPSPGEYRTFNQLADTYSIRQLAGIVTYLTGTKADTLENPRVESPNHYYNPDTNGLRALGYTPSNDILQELTSMLRDLEPFISFINPSIIQPHTKWRSNNERRISPSHLHRHHLGTGRSDSGTYSVGSPKSDSCSGSCRPSAAIGEGRNDSGGCDS